MKKSLYLLQKALPIFLLAYASGCGGGGGSDGNSFGGAAQISLSNSPNTIDTADRTQVTVNIKNVIETGIVLKIRYPVELAYSVNTARLKLDSEDVYTAVTPAFTGTNGRYKYIVFLFPRSVFGSYSATDQTPSETANLSLQLEGKERLKNGVIQADADVKDPTITDSNQFDIAEPKFEASTEASIAVTQTSN